MSVKVPDLRQLSPKLRAAEQRADELKARAVAERARWQQLHDLRLKGRSDDDRVRLAEALLSGKEVCDDDTEYRKQREVTFAFEAASEQAERELPSLRREAGRELTNRLKVDHDRLQKKLFSELVEVKAAWDELQALKRSIQNQGAGINDLFQVDAQPLLGAPNDPSSELNFLLREGHKAGYCKRVN